MRPSELLYKCTVFQRATSHSSMPFTEHSLWHFSCGFPEYMSPMCRQIRLEGSSRGVLNVQEHQIMCFSQDN